jgi:hypothetical protein
MRRREADAGLRATPIMKLKHMQPPITSFIFILYML